MWYNAYCWDKCGSPKRFTGCINWFNSFGKPCDIKYSKLTEHSYLLSINPAWEFMLRGKKKTVKYQMTCDVHLRFYIKKITTLDDLKGPVMEGRIKVNYGKFTGWNFT